MAFFPAPTGSPILARIENQSKLPILAAVAALAVLAVAAVGALMRYFRRMAGDGASERVKNRRTTKGDIAAAAAEYGLLKEDTEFLSLLCARRPVPNVRFLFKDCRRTKELFAEAYRDAASWDDPEYVRDAAVGITERLGRARIASQRLVSTTALPIGQRFLYPEDTGRLFVTELLSKDPHGLLISAPCGASGVPADIADLTPIALVFFRGEGAFTLHVRVIRREAFQGRAALAVSHAARIDAGLKHEYARVYNGASCNVQRVTEITAPDGAVTYRKEGEPFKGRVMNNSSAACLLITDGEGEPGHFLALSPLSGGGETIIVRALYDKPGARPEEGRRSLECAFVSMSALAKRRILAALYGFGAA